MYPQKLQTMVKLKLKSLIKVASIFSCVLMIQACNNTIRTKNYFLPEGFEGNVAIIYSSTGNEKQDVLDFHIPDSGVLRTPYGFSEGNYRINFYQKNRQNSFDTLYEELPSRDVDSSKNRIYFNRILTFQRKGSEEIYTVGSFYVGKKAASDLVEDRLLFERKLEKMVLEK